MLWLKELYSLVVVSAGPLGPALGLLDVAEHMGRDGPDGCLVSIHQLGKGVCGGGKSLPDAFHPNGLPRGQLDFRQISTILRDEIFLEMHGPKQRLPY